jgi:hypothetical protein
MCVTRSLHHYIQAITDIIESILVSEKIKKIKEIVPDTYAEWLDKNDA